MKDRNLHNTILILSFAILVLSFFLYPDIAIPDVGELMLASFPPESAKFKNSISENNSWYVHMLLHTVEDVMKAGEAERLEVVSEWVG